MTWTEFLGDLCELAPVGLIALLAIALVFFAGYLTGAVAHWLLRRWFAVAIVLCAAGEQLQAQAPT